MLNRTPESLIGDGSGLATQAELNASIAAINAATAAVQAQLDAEIAARKAEAEQWGLNLKTKYGALGDGLGTTLGDVYGTLAAAQVFYPSATSLSQTVDNAALTQAIADMQDITNFNGGLGNNAGTWPRGNRTIYVPDPEIAWQFQTVTLNKRTVNIIGNGRTCRCLDSTILLDGSGLGGGYLDFRINGLYFEFTAPGDPSQTPLTPNANAIEMQYAKHGWIENCFFQYADKAIYVRPVTGAVFQHTNRIFISGNEFWGVNYCLYVDKDVNVSNGKNNTSLVVGDIHFQNNNNCTAIISHIYGRGVDGFMCQGNTFFFGYSTASKEVNVLTITAPATGAGNVTVSLDGSGNTDSGALVPFTVALDGSETTTDAVATKIRAATYTGWTTGGAGSVVTFTSTWVGPKTNMTFSAGATGTTGSTTKASLNVTAPCTTSGNVTVTVDGVAKTVALNSAVHTTPELVADAIRTTVTAAGWTVGGVGRAVTFNHATSTSISYSAGTTGAAATLYKFADGTVQKARDFKKQCINMKMGIWIQIQHNQFFESGEEGVLIDGFENMKIQDNHFAWCGQRLITSAIAITNPDYDPVLDNQRGGSYSYYGGNKQTAWKFTLSVISGNNIFYVSEHAIKVDGFNGYMNIFGNISRAEGLVPDHYFGDEYGRPGLGTVPHYSIQTTTTTEMINVFGNQSSTKAMDLRGTNVFYCGNMETLPGNIIRYNNNFTKESAITKTFTENNMYNGNTLDMNGYDFALLNLTTPKTVTGLSSGGRHGRTILLYGATGNCTIAHDAASGYINLANKLNATIPENGILVLEWTSGKQEFIHLQITSGATANGNVTVTLDGTAYTVPILATDNTPALVAKKIRDFDYGDDWVTNGPRGDADPSGSTSSIVTFMAKEIGVRTDATIDFGTTGAAATNGMSTVVQGDGVGKWTEVGRNFELRHIVPVREYTSTIGTLDMNGYDQVNLYFPAAFDVSGISSGFEGKEIMVFSITGLAKMLHSSAVNLIGDASVTIPSGEWMRLRYSSKKEVQKLTVGSAATANGDLQITLDGTVYNVAVLSGDSASTVAGKIRAASFGTGWIAGGSNADVYFIAAANGDKALLTYNANGTGVTLASGSPSVVQDGSNGAWYETSRSFDYPKGRRAKLFDSNVGTLVMNGYEVALLQQLSANTTSGISDGDYYGQVITLLGINGNTTLVHSTDVQLKGGINVTIPLGGTVTLAYLENNWIEIGRNFEWKKTATETFNGTGAQTAFVITHNLGVTPNRAWVHAFSAAAATALVKDWTFNATQLTVNFVNAPASGTGNVIIQYTVEKS
jgi:hypothetical protein